MQAASLAPSAGWQWVRDGLALFRRQPMAMFTWALTIGFMVLVASILAPIGPLLFVAAMPAITVMTLEACRAIEQGKTVLPMRLFLVLKAPGLAKKLLTMGALYVAAVLVAGLVSFLPFAENLREAVQGLSSDDLGPVLEAMRAPIVVFAVLYILIAALFWHAPALVAWHRLDIRKALFFSGVACWRNKGAFLMYGASWLLVVLALELGGGLLEAIGLSATMAGLIQMPFNFLAAAILYCSFYPSYTTVFGPPPPIALGALP
ncbi:MAG: BPSS1780 family membrane protein [Pigmentiphaga sp.]|uniref:BPSS1780 family membrane protein n=1 Tax=Pigmentiphaga sp. TaxID=1977564 RepID=UPI0029AB6462|nr:BPSS1780 family membrane protein [Pigmentiphaga sp.]MDX3908144.1 BPSS1780 family membrane protein [Pigmentiphaga sp.]